MEQDIQILKQAAQEITNLRNTNQIQAARLEMFDSMMLLFRTEPAFPRQGMSEDIVYGINKLVEQKERE